MRSAHLWDFRQRRMVVTDVSGQPIGPIFKDQGTSRPLTMGTDSRNVGNYHSTLPKIPEERRSQNTLWNLTWYNGCATLRMRESADLLFHVMWIWWGKQCIDRRKAVTQLTYADDKWDLIVGVPNPVACTLSQVENVARTLTSSYLERAIRCTFRLRKLTSIQIEHVATYRALFDWIADSDRFLPNLNY